MRAGASTEFDPEEGERRHAGSPDGEGPSAPDADHSGLIERFSRVEKAFLHERFADFERAVLQDNIILCDAKLGILLAFAGAMVVYCLETSTHAGASPRVAPWIGQAEIWAFVAAAVSFFVTCAFCLTAIAPRIHRRREHDDYIFWEARAFRQPLPEFLKEMHGLDVEVEHDNKLRHLHVLAGVCRAKFSHLRHAMNAAAVGFAILVLAELARAFG
jgi:hypothetical protein